jgi:hypothetical protein
MRITDRRKLVSSQIGNAFVVPGKGPACARCGQPMKIRHREITAKELRRAFYYERWFLLHVRGRCYDGGDVGRVQSCSESAQHGALCQMEQVKGVEQDEGNLGSRKLG